MWRGPGEVALEVALGPPEVAPAPRASADSNADCGVVGARRTTFRPLPPPPYAALIATGQPNSLAERDDLVDASLIGSSVPGTDVDVGRGGGLPRRDLVAHDLDRLGRRADPGDAARR